MNADMSDHTPLAKLRARLRTWWLTPPRSGAYRLIAPYEHRHLRFFALGRMAGGCVAAAAGLICLSYGVYGWSAFFLAIAALNLGGGYWFYTLARSTPAQP